MESKLLNSAVLYATADFIEQHGWMQGGSYACADRPYGRACAGLAIAAVVRSTALSSAHAALVEYLYENDSRVYAQINAANRILGVHGCCPPTAFVDPLPIIFTWNDRMGQTQERVVDALRGAAYAEERKEQELIERIQRQALRSEVARVFEHAASYLEEHGWMQDNTTANNQHPQGPACASGALSVASTSHKVYMAAAEILAASIYDNQPEQREFVALSTQIFRWNDAPERTKEEVIAKLRALAMIERAKIFQGMLAEAKVEKAEEVVT